MFLVIKRPLTTGNIRTTEYETAEDLLAEELDGNNIPRERWEEVQAFAQESRPGQHLTITRGPTIRVILVNSLGEFDE